MDGMISLRRRVAPALALIGLIALLAPPWTMAAPPVRNGGGAGDPVAPPPALTDDGADHEPPATSPTPTSAPASPNAHIRPRPANQEFADPKRNDVTANGGNRSARETGDPNGRRKLRLDDPVLRWLPEILAASDATGTPPSLIASVMEVESGGDPRAISPAGARGLMQIMPDEFRVRSVPRSRWHHPQTNILVGAIILAERRVASGSWRGAVARYFGIGCDAHGTCTSVYVRAVFANVNHYARIIRNPERSGLDVLPPDWRFSD